MTSLRKSNFPAYSFNTNLHVGKDGEFGDEVLDIRDFYSAMAEALKNSGF